MEAAAATPPTSAAVSMRPTSRADGRLFPTLFGENWNQRKMKAAELVGVSTVLILGAGSSVDFGMPLGAEMFNAIRRQTHEILAEWARPQRYDDGFISFPTYHSVFRKTLNYYVNLGQNEQRDLDRFNHKLSETGVSTVDQFIDEHPEHLQIMKLCMAAEIVAPHYDHSEHQYTRRARLTGENGRKPWTGKLATMLSQHKHRNPDFGPLHVITLNYESCFFNTFRQFWLNSDNRPCTLDEIVTVRHLHGALGQLQDSTSDLTDVVVHASENLVTIGETGSREVIEECVDIVGLASRVCTLGFAFHPDVVQRLKIANVDSLFCHSFDGRRAERVSMTRIGVPDANVFTATPNLSCEAALDEGLLGFSSHH